MNFLDLSACLLECHGAMVSHPDYIEITGQGETLGQIADAAAATLLSLATPVSTFKSLGFAST